MELTLAVEMLQDGLLLYVCCFAKTPGENGRFEKSKRCDFFCRCMDVKFVTCCS